MSVSIEAVVRSSPRFAEFVDMRDMRRFDDWCRTLGVTRNQLAVAIAEVGEDADEVRAFLRRRRN
jgi:Protein of unknown function (DUF3606)